MKARTSDDRELQAPRPQKDERLAQRDARLAAHGVKIPTGEGMRPLRTVSKRPPWLAFLVRLFR
jgi:hypothetical protein